MAETNEDRLSRYGKSRTELLAELKHARNFDVNWKKGESWGLVYHAGDDVDEITRNALNLFSHGNALDPRAHTKIRDDFLADLDECIHDVEDKDPDACECSAAMYTMMGTMCDQKDLYNFTLDYLDKTYRLN